ncbi:DUF305 domain-containing protein [Nonomuraea sp. NPDC049400]|uniref:DUF305 domain-containing protein n=1 Tax=Nonomuraea sp. NPDC049400 TaxID=3364352 RepID=UPI0037A7628C
MLATVALTGVTVAATDVAQQVTQITSGQASAAPLAGWGTSESAGPVLDASVSDEADYLARMVAYQNEAVAAARHLQRSDRPRMRALGVSISATQGAQTATMKAWLEKWYPERSGTGTGYAPLMRDMSRLSGDALDKAFLCDMIDQHMTSVTMSQQLLVSEWSKHGEVAAFAAEARDDRRAEIFQMQRDSAGWFGGSDMPCGTWDKSQGTQSRGPGTRGW